MSTTIQAPGQVEPRPEDAEIYLVFQVHEGFTTEDLIRSLGLDIYQPTLVKSFKIVELPKDSEIST